MAAVAKITFLVERGEKWIWIFLLRLLILAKKGDGKPYLKKKKKNLGSQWENKALRKTPQAPLKSVHDETMLDPPTPNPAFRQ